MYRLAGSRTILEERCWKELAWLLFCSPLGDGPIIREFHLFLWAERSCYFFYEAPIFIFVRIVLIELSAHFRIALTLLLYLLLHLYQALNVVFVEEKGATLLTPLLPDLLVA